MFDFSNDLAKSKYIDDSNKLLVDEMKIVKADVNVEEYVEWKPNINSFLLDDSSDHKKAKGVSKNVIATICRAE